MTRRNVSQEPSGIRSTVRVVDHAGDFFAVLNHICIPIVSAHEWIGPAVSLLGAFILALLGLMVRLHGGTNRMADSFVGIVLVNRPARLAAHDLVSKRTHKAGRRTITALRVGHRVLSLATVFARLPALDLATRLAALRTVQEFALTRSLSGLHRPDLIQHLVGQISRIFTSIIALATGRTLPTHNFPCVRTRQKLGQSTDATASHGVIVIFPQEIIGHRACATVLLFRPPALLQTLGGLLLVMLLVQLGLLPSFHRHAMLLGKLLVLLQISLGMLPLLLADLSSLVHHAASQNLPHEAGTLTLRDAIVSAAIRHTAAHILLGPTAVLHWSVRDRVLLGLLLVLVLLGKGWTHSRRSADKPHVAASGEAISR